MSEELKNTSDKYHCRCFRINPKDIEMDPEPTPEHTEKKCGLGTELVDGYCQVIGSQTKEEPKGFLIG